jgi:hypothetical protein
MSADVTVESFNITFSTKAIEGQQWDYSITFSETA